MQYAADNLYHNTLTLDGHNTFHGIFMIAIVTLDTKTNKHVPRVTMPTEDIYAIGHVSIKYFSSFSEHVSSLTYNALAIPDEEDQTSSLDMLWKASHLMHPNTPGWSGLMQMVQEGNQPGKASVFFLPIIDMNPGDLSCIYSILSIVCSHAKKYYITPILTSDRPLWWKTIRIRESELNDSDLHAIA